MIQGSLVIVFKNCCLKRCENCGLKSVIEKRVFSVNKTKKVFDIRFKEHFLVFKKYKICVWYVCLNDKKS